VRTDHQTGEEKDPEIVPPTQMLGFRFQRLVSQLRKAVVKENVSVHLVPGIYLDGNRSYVVKNWGARKNNLIPPHFFVWNLKESRNGIIFYLAIPKQTTGKKDLGERSQQGCIILDWM
jgi:hypothetical protein